MITFAHLLAPLTFDIVPIGEIPNDWPNGQGNTFFSPSYLKALAHAAPVNMECFLIVFRSGDSVKGGALAQYLDLQHLDSFGDRDRCLKTMVRDTLFRNFASRVLFIGNNMLTGQHAFFHDHDLDRVTFLKVLKQASAALEQQLAKSGKSVHITTFKDFDQADAKLMAEAGFSDWYRFSTQPNMNMSLDRWKNPDDYTGTLNKKYRDQFKRARKKFADLSFRELNLTEIETNRSRIYSLYDHVARNAPFNTFFLSQDHFESLKRHLGEDFHLFGYFLKDELIGFKTLIRNGDTLETYFLGYDEKVQKQFMLYLNMLYDMIAFGISNGFSEIVFARTALEIKSSVGAVPEEVFGFMKHRNKWLDKMLPRIFPRLEPEMIWQQRHPFK